MSSIEPPTLDEVRRAVDIVREVVVRTPLVRLHGSPSADDILLKPEIHQVVGSFKIRGVFHAVARMDEKARAAGISTISAGNTAQAIAWAGRHFGVPARSIMPETAPRTKIDAVRNYGAEAVLLPVDELFGYMREHGWEQEPYAFVHPWFDHDLHAGHGTMALEILEERPDVETVFIPVGGGGLIGGVGPTLKALKPSIRIVAVEPTGCPSLYESLNAGRPVSVEADTFCDGVSVPYMTEEMFPLIKSVTDESVLVPEDVVKTMVRRLALEDKMVVEGSGALAVAAAQEIPRAERGVSVCLVTGGSIDRDKLVSIL